MERPRVGRKLLEPSPFFYKGLIIVLSEKWTEEEIEFLTKKKKEGFLNKEIAEQLGRSLPSVRNQIGNLKIGSRISPNEKHGLYQHPIYGSWKSIIQRCYNKKGRDYIGKNIKVYRDWKDDFQSFYDWAIQYWENGLCLSRKDEGGDFSPSNCYFTTRDEWRKDRREKRVKGFLKNPRSIKVIEKIKQTNLKRYGVENPAQARIKRGHTFIKNGKTIKEWAIERDRSISGLSLLIKKYGEDFALSLAKNTSLIENIIKGFLIDNNIIFEEQKFIKIDEQKKFPDFFLPEHNLIIECDGLYWHSDAIKEDKNYHKEKQVLYKKYSYSSLFFREDEINNKLEIISSIILNKIGQTKTKIFARKCERILLSREERKEFFSTNHLMGNGSGKCFALRYEGEIVCAMQFVVRRNYTDISRFCNKLNTTVVGGFSRLIKRIELAVQPDRIQTFIDLRYGSGEYLKGLGFRKESENLSFKWVKSNVVVHRMRFTGNSGYEEGFFKLWDCGQAKYVKGENDVS